MAERFTVFVAIERERHYQDEKWGGRKHDEGHSIQDWLEMMSERMRLALDRAVPEPEAAMDQLRKIAAMAPKERKAMDQKPSVGRIVHYTNLGDSEGKYPPETNAAIITKVHGDEGIVDLKIFYPTGIFDRQTVLFSDLPQRGHWNWPPRV